MMEKGSRVGSALACVRCGYKQSGKHNAVCGCLTQASQVTNKRRQRTELESWKIILFTEVETNQGNSNVIRLNLFSLELIVLPV
jgi:hypothetical protein